MRYISNKLPSGFLIFSQNYENKLIDAKVTHEKSDIVVQNVDNGIILLCVTHEKNELISL